MELQLHHQPSCLRSAQVYTADLESALHYLLRVELATRTHLEGEELSIFKDLVTVVAKVTQDQQRWRRVPARSKLRTNTLPPSLSSSSPPPSLSLLLLPLFLSTSRSILPLSLSPLAPSLCLSLLPLHLSSSIQVEDLWLN